MRPARIMIVEDERITAEHLKDVLCELGYVVTALVSNGADAIQQAERTAPDLVLMDIRIEGQMDGVETARIIRERCGVPAVYLTAHADRGTLDRAKQAEPLGYLVKPFQESELQASIEMALYKNQQDRGAQARENRLTATFSAMGEAVIAIDKAGLITLLNPVAEAWTGWEQQNGLGKSIEEVFRIVSGKTRSPLNNPLRSAAREGLLVEVEEGALLVSRHDAEQPIAGTAAPIKDHQGNLSGAVLVFGSFKGDSARRPDSAAPGRRGAENVRAGAFEMVFDSEAMRRTVHFASRVAASEASTILIEGESGTGKDVLARYLHHKSRREAQPFIAINCAAIPETLLESELFGYEKGAFTDAKAQKKGILELGTGGTVLLDEIGELPLMLQAKLLRVLEEQCFRRLGGVKDIQVDLRVIAATNRSLPEAVSQGKFRVDLFYRLNVIQLVVPPLRGRRDDILPLANHFVQFYNRRFGREIRGISPEAAQALLGHDWPGNIRELRNAIERAMILEETPWLQASSLAVAGDPMVAPALGESEQAKDPSLDGMSLEDAERMLLVRALEQTRGNQTQAALLLKITRDTLRYKMKKFNLTSAP